jgi:RNA polymerase sigma factor (sigma-70 family)
MKKNTKKNLKNSSTGSNSAQNESDLKLVLAVKNDQCEKSFLELSEKYSNVFYKICQKYTPALVVSGVCPDDIYKEKTFILYKCALSFDPSRNTKFSTWLGNYARYICLHAINAKKFILPSTDEEISQFIEDKQQQINYNFSKREEDYELVTSLLSKINDERFRKVLTLRYLADTKKTWKQIAEDMDVSVQTVITIHNRALQFLKNKIIKLEK